MKDYERISSQFEEDFPLKKESIVWKIAGFIAITFIVGTLIYSVIR